MNLKDKFNKFCGIENNYPSKQNIREFIVKNGDKIDLAWNVAKTMKEFAVNKSYFSLIEGTIDTIRDLVLDRAFYASDYFTPSQGWERLESSSGNLVLDGLFASVLDKFTFKPFKFVNDPSHVKFIDSPLGEIGYVVNGQEESIYFRSDRTTSKDLIKFLIDEKIKELNTSFISFNYSNDKCNLVIEPIEAIPSAKANYYSEYIKKFWAHGLNRSLLFYGLPGMGKSCLAQTIISNLGIRTLKFRFNDHYDYDIFSFVVKNFNIEAVILDDFDQINSDKDMLEFLTMLKRETKLVIALVNSLDNFHPAIKRPDRIDEIILINNLEEEAIKNLMGPELYNAYGEKVAHFPVAYINEFVHRANVLGPDELESSFEDLANRVAELSE